MEYAALAVALVALIIALSARSKAAGLAQSVEDATNDARRRVENANVERTAELDVLRKQLAKIARGEELSEDMISRAARGATRARKRASRSSHPATYVSSMSAPDRKWPRASSPAQS
jgi:hypothetical protein